MYNSDTPLRAELPSSKQLLRSTILAAIAALVLLIAVVLPAEYGIDPTGAGRALRLTEMGQIKNKLAAEAAADAQAANKKVAAATSPVDTNTVPRDVVVARSTVALPVTVAADVAEPIQWRDTTPVTLKPGEGTEVKMAMTEGAKAQYLWTVESGQVNYDAHGDGAGQSISYKKGRGASSDEGVLNAAFTGNHGWFWRNRGESDVKLVLRTRGEYTEIKK